MSDIAALIKKAALDAVENEKPVAVMFGVVSAASPLVVDVEQKLRLSGVLLVVFKDIELAPGDTVVLLREQGGQRFIVLGVV